MSIAENFSIWNSKIRWIYNIVNICCRDTEYYKSSPLSVHRDPSIWDRGLLSHYLNPRRIHWGSTTPHSKFKVRSWLMAGAVWSRNLTIIHFNYSAFDLGQRTSALCFVWFLCGSECRVGLRCTPVDGLSWRIVLVSKFQFFLLNRFK